MGHFPWLHGKNTGCHLRHDHRNTARRECVEEAHGLGRVASQRRKCALLAPCWRPQVASQPMTKSETSPGSTWEWSISGAKVPENERMWIIKPGDAEWFWLWFWLGGDGGDGENLDCNEQWKKTEGGASQRNAGSHAGFPHVKLETPNLIESHRTTWLSRRSAKFGWTNAMGIYGVILLKKTQIPPAYSSMFNPCRCQKVWTFKGLDGPNQV